MFLQYFLTLFFALFLVMEPSFSQDTGSNSESKPYSFANRRYGEQYKVGDPISAGNGAYTLDLPLLTLYGPLDLNFVLYYRSDNANWYTRDPNDFPNNGGDTWENYSRFWWGPRLRAGLFGDETTFWLENGEVVTFINGLLFEEAQESSYSPNNGQPVRYSMQLTENYVYLLDPINERIYIFERSDEYTADGRILFVMDRNGNTMTFTYAKSTDSNPSQISDNTGRQLNFTYSDHDPSNSEQWFLDRVSDQGGRNVNFTYDLGTDNGNGWTLRTIQDPLGHSMTFTYDVATNGTYTYRDNIAQIVLPNGNIPNTNNFDVVGINNSFAARVVSQKDAYDHTTTIQYSNGENSSYLTTTTFPDGNQDIYEHYSHHSLPKGYTDAAGNAVTVIKNASEQLTAVNDRMGASTLFTYHAETGKIATMTNPEGKTVTFSYTPQEQTFQNPINQETIAFTFYNQAKIQYPDDSNESFVYDDHGNIIEKIDRRGKSWKYEYNTLGLITKMINPNGGEVIATLNADGTLAGVKDSETGETTYTYDEFKRIATITNADGTTKSFTYDLNDRPLTVTDENNHTYHYAYDPNGNLTQITDPASHTFQYAYDLMDRISQYTDRRGMKTTYTYNEKGLTATIQDPNQVTTELKYDPRDWVNQITIANKTWHLAYDDEGSLISSTSPENQNTEYQNDVQGRATEITNPLQQKTSFTYDAMGNIVTLQESANPAMNFQYDSGGLLTGIAVDPLGSISYQYDDVGQLTQILDFNGHPWKFNYSPSGRLTTHEDPEGHLWTLSYDLRGRLSTLSDPSGTQASYTYDGVGNLTRLQYSEGTDLSFGYNELDQLIAANRISFSRDAEGRITNSLDQQVSFDARYDSGGRIESVSYNNDLFSVQYSYDETTGFLKQIKDTLTNTTLDFQYDSSGRIVSIDRSPGNIQSLYTFDQTDRLIRIQEGNLFDLQYNYNAAGYVSQLQSSTTDISLPISGTQEWEYNAASEIASSGYAFDSLGRLTQSPQHTCAWDGASRLQQLDDTTFQYNGMNSLILRSHGGSTTHYYYNYALPHAPIMAEKDENSGEFLRYYVWSPDGNLLYMIDATKANKVYYYHFDRIGSTIALSDSQGTVTDTYAYTPYGVLVNHTGENTQPFTYVGQWGVRQEGNQGTIYHMQARYYDAETAHFLTRDPAWPDLASPLEINPYAYALLNPLLYRDPSGTNILELVSTVVGGVGITFGLGFGLLYDTSNFFKSFSIRESHCKHLTFLKWPKKIAGYLELGHYVSGTSFAARLTGVTALIWKLLKVPVEITSKGVQVIGPAVQGSKLAPLFIKGANVVGKVALIGTLISGAISWAEIIDRTLFTSAAENSRMVGLESKSSNIFTRASSLFGRWIGDLIYGRDDKLYAMTPAAREQFLQEEARRSEEHWRKIREENESHGGFGSIWYK